MYKEVVQALETGLLGQIGLVAFVVAFAMILLYTFTLSRKQREEAKALPLENDEELPVPTV